MSLYPHHCPVLSPYPHHCHITLTNRSTSLPRDAHSLLASNGQTCFEIHRTQTYMLVSHKTISPSIDTRVGHALRQIVPTLYIRAHMRQYVHLCGICGICASERKGAWPTLIETICPTLLSMFQCTKAPALDYTAHSLAVWVKGDL